MGVRLYLKRYNPSGEQDPEAQNQNWFTAADEGTMEANLDGLDSDEANLGQSSRSYEGTYSASVGTGTGLSGLQSKLFKVDDEIRLLPLTEYTVKARVLVNTVFEHPVLYRIRIGREGWGDGLWFEGKEYTLQDKDEHVNKWIEITGKIITGNETLGKIYIEQYGIGVVYSDRDDNFFVHLDSVEIRKGVNFSTVNFETFEESVYQVKDTLDGKIDYQFRDWKKIGERFRKDASKILSLIDEGNPFNVLEVPGSLRGESYYKDLLWGRIETNGQVPILEGVFRLMDIEERNHIVLYKGQLTGKKSGWLETIRDKEFCDLDWSEYDHRLTPNYVEESWDNNGDSGLMVYDLFDQGNYTGVTGRVVLDFGTATGIGSGDCILGDINVDDAFQVTWQGDLESTLDEMISDINSFTNALGDDKYLATRSGTVVTITLQDSLIESMDITIDWVECADVGNVTGSIAQDNQTVTVMGDLTEIRPSLFVKQMLIKIFRISGYTMQIRGESGDFLCSDEFRDLVIRWGGGGLDGLEEAPSEIQTVFGYNTNNDTPEIDSGNYDELEFDGDEFDPNSWITGNCFEKVPGAKVTVVITMDGCDACGEGSVEGSCSYVYPEISPQDNTQQCIELDFWYDNGLQGTGTWNGESLDNHIYWVKVTWGSTGEVCYIFDPDEPQWADEGHIITVIDDLGNGCYRVNFDYNGDPGQPETYTICPSVINGNSKDTYIEMTIRNPDKVGYFVDWNQNMLCENIRDFMEDLANQFNFFYITEESTKTVTIIEEDSYYADLDNQEDWTKKIDREEMVWQKLARFYNRRLTLNYKAAGGDQNISDLEQGREAITDQMSQPQIDALDFDGLKQVDGVDFGGEIFDTGVLNSKDGDGSLIRLSILGATYMATRNGMWMPYADLGQDGGDLNTVRINIYGGLQQIEDGGAFGFTNILNNDFRSFYQLYPKSYFYGKPTDELKNLGYTNWTEHEATSDWTDQPGLMEVHYKSVLLTIRHGRLLTTYADLQHKEVKDRKFNTEIWIDDNKFHLAKILSYDPHSEGFAKVELIARLWYLEDQENLTQGIDGYDGK